MSTKRIDKKKKKNHDMRMSTIRIFELTNYDIDMDWDQVYLMQLRWMTEIVKSNLKSQLLDNKKKRKSLKKKLRIVKNCCEREGC